MFSYLYQVNAAIFSNLNSRFSLSHGLGKLHNPILIWVGEIAKSVQRVTRKER